MNRKGFVLLQVLMMGIVIATICAVILRLALQPSLNGANATSRSSQFLSADAAINKVRAAWDAAGTTCASGSGVKCSGGSGGCACNCTVSGGASVGSSAGAGGACSLSVTR